MVVDALETAWGVWAELGLSLSEEQWQRPTRLEGWTVKAVFAHCGIWPDGAAASAQNPPSDREVTHPLASDLLRQWNQPGGLAEATARDVQQAAVGGAEDQPTGTLVQQFAEVGPRAVELLRSTDLDRHLDYFGQAVIPLREAVRIGLLEAVVHYLDIADALGLPAPGPMTGEPVRLTTDLLTEMADPVALIDAATGRGTPAVFPVLR